MGLFPILMNVLQFWLVDSIVKASSAVVLPSDSPRNSTDREPLFNADEESDGNEDPSELPDIEAQRRSRPRSQSADAKANHRPSHDIEQKFSGSGPGPSSLPGPHESMSRIDATVHAYPPSTSPPGSPTSPLTTGTSPA